MARKPKLKTKALFKGSPRAEKIRKQVKKKYGKLYLGSK